MPEFWTGIAIGSNQDNPMERVVEARERVRQSFPWTEFRSSSWYQTSPVGPIAQDDFINGVVVGRCAVQPSEMLSELLALERHLGRVRQVHWGPRRVDLDLLFVGSTVIETRSLSLPHPRMHERGFVLVPLNEVCKEWIHPLLHRTVNQLVEAWEMSRNPDDRVTHIELKGEQRRGVR